MYPGESAVLQRKDVAAADGNAMMQQGPSPVTSSADPGSAHANPCVSL
jgi:hypothetical protein